MNRALAPLLLAFLCYAHALHAQENVIRIGVLTDLSGSMAEAAGQGSVEAAEMAVEDSARFLHRPVTLVTADYQSRADLAQHISEDWLKRQNVDMVVDVPNAVIAGHLQDLFRAEGKILLASSPRRPDADDLCGTNGIFWLYDRDTLTENLFRALIAEHKQHWFILGGDTPYGMMAASNAKTFLQKNGGEVVGEAYLGPRMAGLPVILNQIKNARADVVYLAFGRLEIMHLLRHWPEENANDIGPPLAFPTLPFSDIAELKDRPVPPFYTLASFYWNQDEAARNFSDRFAQRQHGLMPTSIHASVYSAVYHYLQSIAATNNKATETVLAHMKATPLQDGLFAGSHIRADGMLLHHMYLLFLKRASEREGPYDFFRVVHTLTPAEILPPPEAPCAKTGQPR